MIRVDCLNLVQCLFTPHCNEKDRLEHTKDLLDAQDIIEIALSDCAAVEIIDDKYRLITSDASLHNIPPYGVKSYWMDGEYHQASIEQSNDLKSLSDLLSREPHNTHK